MSTTERRSTRERPVRAPADDTSEHPSEVVLAILADHAVAVQTGKMDILGAGITKLTLPSFPGMIQELSLALVLKVATTQRRSYQIRVLDMSGAPIAPLYGFTIQPATISGRATEVAFPLVYTLQRLVFTVPGRYTLRVEEAGRLLVEVPFEATDQPPTPPVPIPLITLTDEIRSTFEAYLAGDTLASTKGLEDLVARFPDAADAHNNLGFCYLSLNRIADSLREFESAARAGYNMPELLRANTACCQFLAGDYRGASDTFQSLLASRLQSVPVVLFALGRQRAQPIVLQSPGDYLALVSLNAARCCLQLGETSQARHFASIASVGAETFKPPSLAGFELLLRELSAEISGVVGGAPEIGESLRTK